MADSSSVVLLPSTADVCSTLASSMMVWSEGEVLVNHLKYNHLTFFVQISFILQVQLQRLYLFLTSIETFGPYSGVGSHMHAAPSKP